MSGYETINFHMRFAFLFTDTISHEQELPITGPVIWSNFPVANEIKTNPDFEYSTVTLILNPNPKP